MENYGRYMNRTDIDEYQRRRMFDEDLRRRFGDGRPYNYYPYFDRRRPNAGYDSDNFVDCVMRCRNRY